MSDGLQIVISADVKDLTTNLNKAEKATEQFANKSAKNIKKGSADASFALGSLSRVAQDAPFGFIAIQNNIIPVFESFAQFARNTGGPIGALKSLGSAILGPAGIVAGISILISVITSLVQKYGSLSAAIGALTAKNKEAYISQLQYNKEIAKNDAEVNVQIATINKLVKSLNDSSSSRDAQLAAFVQLKKIQPDITAGITTENALTTENIALVNLRTLSYMNYIKLRAKENAINAVAQSNEQKIVELKIKQQEEDNNIVKLEAQANAARKSGAKELYTVLASQLLIARDNSRAYGDEIFNLNNVTASYYDQLDPVIKGISQYNLGIQKTAEEIAKQIKAEQERQAAIKKAAAEADRIEKERQKAIKERKLLLEDLDNYITKQGAGKDFYKQNQENLSAIERLRQFFKNFEPKKITQPIEVYPSEKVQQDERNLALITSKGQQYFTFLAPFIDNVFNAIENGQNAFQALGQSIKSFVVELVKALVKTAALAAIISIVSSAFGTPIPFGAAFKIASKSTGLSPNQAAAPSIGSAAGLTGGLQLGGQVVFVQRGYDLVGVLNAANGSIRNIG